ncbi:hypothetical protein DIPPA_11399 [Diplonema papillatum]|nr:hypothetical protein DIPPA_11399 [Diplonema papillatum]
MSVIVTLPDSRQQINAWHKERHVMKEHSSEFCGTGSRGGGKMEAKPEPIDWERHVEGDALPPGTHVPPEHISIPSAFLQSPPEH